MKSEHGKMIVKNFGPIKHAEVDLKQVLILIGPQGTGKSTLLKIINGVERYARLHSMSHRISVSDFKHLAFFDLGIADMVTSDTQIEFTTPKFKIISEKEYILLSNPSDHNLWNLRELVFIPSERMFFSTFNQNIYYFLKPEIKIPEILKKLGIEWSEAKKRITQLQLDYLNARYIQINEDDHILYDEKNGRSVPLEKSASGFQSSIPLALIIENISRQSPPAISNDIGEFTFLPNEEQLICSIFIEEPEINLFPDAQKKLVEFMSSRLIHHHEKPHSLYIATHSPYILTAFDNLIQASNAFEKHQDLKKKIDKIIPKECWIDFDEVSAYYLEDGKTTSILNKKNRTIAANKLDKVSEEIAIEFEKLLDITYQPA